MTGRRVLKLDGHQSASHPRRVGTTLPPDLARDQALRLQLLNGLGVVLWLLAAVMDAWMAPHGDRGPYRFVIEGTGAAVAAATACHVRWGPSDERVRRRVGLASLLVHAVALALLNSWSPQPTTTRPLSGIAVLLLLFGMLAPAPPKQMLVAGLVAASMDPFGVWIAHLRGLEVPAPFPTVLLFYQNYLCALIATAPARLLYRLGHTISQARALGNYELVERLGEGGMGEVWLARHRRLARRAAVKLIRPDVLAGNADRADVTRERFEREAQATAMLTSPHTIRLFDFGTADDGTFYYAMELLDGHDLESLVREFGPVPPSRALHFVRQVCRSLAEAHALGLVHRDVTPANVYVCRLGLEYDVVKVLDFGLVKHEDPGLGPTMLTAPVAVGTPSCMAPEVILGESVADRRVDVYAVGCVAYFLLTGEHVFEAASPMKVLLQHVQDAPIPPSRRTSQFVPPDVDALVLACLEKDPGKRPRDADALHRMALACDAGDVWDDDAARAWWTTHLPALAHPGEADASGTPRAMEAGA